jgi:NAD(P)-dependent dehydrogenase (short-subunit alcohol dehydrogenase family)
MANLLDLSGKTVLITGGLGDIGRVVVKTLSEHGAAVCVNDIVEQGEGERRTATLSTGGRTLYVQADVTDPGAVDALFERVEAQLGLPDVVCCHAGLVASDPVERFPLETYDAIMNLNVRSSFIVAQAATQRWKERGTRGQLIFTSSWVQDVPWPEITPYTASKSALKALARGFARELAPDIRANVIAPGIVAVGMAKRQWDTEPGYRARAERAIPLGYMQPPESVAHAFLFLCSPLADYLTGSVLLVDGGASLYPMDSDE